MTCSYIIQRLGGIPSAVTCYYFCNGQDTGNVGHQILKTVVLQLVRHVPDLTSLIANEFVYPAASCGIAQIKMLISQLLEVVPNTRIVVDGIDECSKDNQKSIIKDLQNVCIGPTTQCKVIFSSRREVSIRERLVARPQISLDGREEVDFDIRSYVKHRMKKLATSDGALLNRVESILVEKADGNKLYHLI